MAYWKGMVTMCALVVLVFILVDQGSCGENRHEAGLHVVSCVDGGQSIDAMGMDGIVRVYGFRKAYPACWTWTTSAYWDIELGQCRGDFYNCRVISARPMGIKR